MKRKFKYILSMIAMCAVSALMFTAVGCNEPTKRCEHQMVDGEVIKEATCSSMGVKTMKCMHCNLTETVDIEYLSHTEVIVPAVAPTCTQSGSTSGVKCAVCNKIFVPQTLVNPTGHKVLTDDSVAPTCTVAGKTEGSHCQYCGLVFVAQESIPMLAHEMEESGAYSATCEETGYTGGSKCKYCDYAESGEIIEALGHAYNEGVITMAATCEMQGEKTITCETCNEIKIELLPAVGHNFESGVCGRCGVAEPSPKVKVSGVWYFNTDLGSLKDSTIGDGGESEYVTFTSNGRLFTEIDAEVKSLFYANGADCEYVYDVNTDAVPYGWLLEEYRYIEFQGEQKVSEKFYNWLVTYAIQVPSKPEDDLQGTWMWDSWIIFDNGGVRYTTFNVNFTSNGKSFTSLATRHYNNSGGGYYEMLYDTVSVFHDDLADNHGWSNEAYRMITITDTLEDVEDGEELLEYLNLYAVKLDSFTINDKTYYTEQDMTWEEWCESEYNTTGYFVAKEDSGIVLYEPSVGTYIWSDFTNSVKVYATDKIMANYAYRFKAHVPHSGGSN